MGWGKVVLEDKISSSISETRKDSGKVTMESLRQSVGNQIPIANPKHFPKLSCWQRENND